MSVSLLRNVSETANSQLKIIVMKDSNYMPHEAYPREDLTLFAGAVLLGICALCFIIFVMVSAERDFVRTETSPEVMTEKATVADLVYSPANSSLELNPTFTMHDDGLKVGLSLDSVDLPEKYAVVFECQHGKFIIKKDQKRTKQLWERLKKGQEVTVKYAEVYKVTEHGTLNGPKQFVKRELAKYDFLDAN